jgi:hypothetical protein
MRAELALFVALLVGAWLVVGNGGSPSSSPYRPASTGDLSASSRVGAGLSERAEALREYFATPRPRGPVRRNPFRFGEAPPAAAGRRGRLLSEVSPTAAPAPSRPEMALSGVAEETANGHPLRTAIISVTGQLAFAREGDRVLSRFVVLHVAADAVQLKDGEGGEVFTLALK